MVLQVVNGTEDAAKILVGQVRYRPAVRRPALFKGGRGDEQGSDEAGSHEKKAHDERGRRQQPPGIADAKFEIVVTFNQRHDGYGGLWEPERPGPGGERAGTTIR